MISTSCRIAYQQYRCCDAGRLHDEGHRGASRRVTIRGRFASWRGDSEPSPVAKCRASILRQAATNHTEYAR